MKLSDLDQPTAGPWDDLNTDPPLQLLALELSLHAAVVQSWLQGADLGWLWRGLLGQGQHHVNTTVWAWLWKSLEGAKSGPHV